MIGSLNQVLDSTQTQAHAPRRARCWQAVGQRVPGGSSGPATAPVCPSHQPQRPRTLCVRLAAVPATATTAPTTQDPVSASQATQQSQQVAIPEHWDQQMKSAPLGKRRVLQRYYEELQRINSFEADMMNLSDEQLRAKTAYLKSRLRAGTTLDSLLPEAFAVVREASRRVLGMRHFDSQMVGGMVLHGGAVAEMSTGEGKTLVATLPAYLNALTGRRVHVVTVNDYLATRDAEWMGKVYSFLGLTCSAVHSDMTAAQYKAAYSSDITYVTGQELGFAYLRDNTAPSAHDLVLPADLHYAIVDEADSILIDESRNPLIISLAITENEQAVLLVDRLVRPMFEEVASISEQSESMIRHSYYSAWGDRMSENVRQLMERDIKNAGDAVKGKYYKVDQKARSITLTPLAIEILLQGLLAEGVVFRAAVEENRAPTPTDVFEDPARFGQLAITAFKAYELYQLGKQYIVRDNRVILIDENTGRLRDITRWQDGLHQAVEAKERVPIKQETLPTASITFQVFFRFYSKLAGMTGTAAPAAAEFFELYKLKVVQVPTNKPIRRVDLSSRFYFDPEGRTAELCRIVEGCWLKGRPLLIGTTSVQQSEAVLQALLEGTSHQAFAQQQAAIQVLNAKPEKVRMESQVVAQAGLPGCVTIATNMAGRGTDIILGGAAEGLTKLVLMRLVYRQLMTAEDAASIPSLPYQLRTGPLGVYDSAQSVTAAMEGLKTATQKGLPFEVHVALMGAMLLADAEAQKTRASTVPQSQGLTYDQARSLVMWAVDTSAALLREGYERIRSKFEGVPLTDLEFSVCIAPVLADVLLDRESTYADRPKGQVFALKAAVMLRAWLDRQCASWGASVRKEGGLLVVGMSMQESRRVELQLRGRAGRQGDPGTTIMMYDIYDPYIAVQNSTGIFEMVRQMDKSRGVPFRFIDGPLVDTLVTQTQRSVESYFSNSRLEMKRYDEIVDDYRQSVYRLRKLILLGTSQQSTQVLYMFIQSWVDELVSQHLGSGDRDPESWLTPSLPVSSLPLELRGLQAAAAGQGSVRAGALEPEGGERVSPWEVVMRSLEQLVNPLGRVGRTTWEFQQLKEGIAKDEGMRKVLGMFGMLGTRPGAGGEGSTPGVLSLPLDTDTVTLLTPRQMQDLACFITGVPLQSDATQTHTDAPPSSSQTGSHTARDLETQTAQLHFGSNGTSQHHSQQSAALSQSQPASTSSSQQLPPPSQGGGGLLRWWLRSRKQPNKLQGPQLPWPQPPMRLTAKQQLSITTHARLYGMHFSSPQPMSSILPVHSISGGGSATSRHRHSSHYRDSDSAPLTDSGVFEAVTGLPAHTAPTIAQRPPLKGKHAHKVQLLRNYLGLVVIHAFEQRRVAACKTLQARGAAVLDMDAQDQTWAYEREVMLNWLDAVWSVFLQEVEALKKAVAVKTYGSASPLAEFQLEVNRTFLGMLATYREATVAQVLVPNMTITTSLDDHEPDSSPAGPTAL